MFLWLLAAASALGAQAGRIKAASLLAAMNSTAHATAARPRRARIARLTAAAAVAVAGAPAAAFTPSLQAPHLHPLESTLGGDSAPLTGGRAFERLGREKPRLQASSVRKLLGKWGDKIKEIRAEASARRVMFRASSPGYRDMAIKAVPTDARTNEIEALRKLGGGDIVQFFAYLTPRTRDTALPQQDPHTLLFMEAADGDLMKVLQAKKELSSSVKLRIVIEMLRAIVKMEKAGWVHRDVQPPNLFVFGDCFDDDEGCHIKVGEFGEAARVEAIPEAGAMAMSASPYVAPEVWDGAGDQSKNDIWSAGMVAFELFVGAVPAALERAPPSEALDIAGDPGFQRLAGSDAEVAALLRSMLQESPVKRASAEAALAMATKLAEKWGIEVPEQPRVYWNWPMAAA